MKLIAKDLTQPGPTVGYENQVTGPDYRIKDLHI